MHAHRERRFASTTGRAIPFGLSRKDPAEWLQGTVRRKWRPPGRRSCWGWGEVPSGGCGCSKVCYLWPLPLCFLLHEARSVCVSPTHPLPANEVCGASSSTCSPPVTMRSPPECLPVCLSAAGRLSALLSPSRAGGLRVASGRGWDARRHAAATHWEWGLAPATLGGSKPAFPSRLSRRVTSAHSREAVQ